ncbi:hypothetical protein TNCV_3312801 [Trichonephila clavipes]|nr:hypothetical protein TNCV_3312801 [Trichonephila clavipes]
MWHTLCDMLRRLVGTTAPGHHDCSIRNEKNSNHGSIPITLDCNVVVFIVFEEEQRQSRFGPIRRIYALLDDRFDELPNQTENKSLGSC